MSGTAGKWAAPGLVLAMVILALALYSDSDETATSRYRFSTYSAAPTGLKAFYMLLKESNFDVHRGRRELDRYDPREKILLISAAPVEPFSIEEIDAMYELVRSGSTCLLFYGPMLEPVLNRFGLAADSAKWPSEWSCQSPAANALLPKRLHGFVGQDTGRYGGVFNLSGGSAVPVYGSDRVSVVAELAVDSGAVVFVGSPLFVSNAWIGDSVNVTAMMSLLTRDRQGRQRSFERIVFDECHQGYGEYRSFLRGLDHPAVRTGVLFALVAVIAFVYSRGKRIGRPVPIRQPSRRSSLDYVESVANVYERARANRWVLKTWYEWVRRHYAVRFNTNRNDRLAEQLSRRYGFNKEEIQRLMDTVEKKLADADIQASHGETVRRRPVTISDEELVRLVGQLDELYKASSQQSPHQRNR